MKRSFSIFVFILLFIIITAILFFGKFSTKPSFDDIEVSDKKHYKRIISMAPSITETLFALGAGDRVVGVTRFCNYPPEAREKEQVGGFVDPNYEAVVALKPDLVILLPEHEKVFNYLAELRLQYLVVHNRNVSEILDTILTIGIICGAEERAKEMTADINARIQNILVQTKDRYHPGVMISISRTIGTGALKDVYIAGKNTFYDELLTFAGGRNAYDGPNIDYPVISAEGLLHINPEIIIDLVPDMEPKGLDGAALMREWQSVPGVAAVRNNRIYIVSNDYAVIPGPRFILFLEYLTQIIHPKN